MAEQKLVGQNYTVPDLVAKVTGKSKYAEDFRAEGMIFAKLLLSPLPHARVTRLDVSAALAMPGVKAIVTADDLPAPADSVNDNGQVILANLDGEVALTNEPVYQGQPILAVAAVDEVTAADAIEKIEIEFEPLPFTVDPLVSLRPGGPNARTKGNYWFIPPPAPPAPAGPSGQAQSPPRPEIREMKWTAAELAEADAGRLPMMEDAPEKWSYGDLEAGFKDAALVLDETFVTPDTSHQTLETRTVMAYWQNGKVHVYTGTQSTAQTVLGRRAMGRRPSRRRRRRQRVHGRRVRQQDHRRHLAGHPGAPGEEGECPGDDADQPRGRALHRPRPSGRARPDEGRLLEGRPHHARSTCARSATTVRSSARAIATTPA